MKTPTPEATAASKAYGLDDFFREARERGLTANDLVAGLRARGDIPPANAVQKAIAAGEELARTVELFMDSMTQISKLEQSIEEEVNDAVELATAEGLLSKAQESRTDLWGSVKNDLADFRRRAAMAKESAAGLMSLQEVWDAAGGNPCRSPTRDEVMFALKTLDQVCTEAAKTEQLKLPEPGQPMSHRDALKAAFKLSRGIGFGEVPDGSVDAPDAPRDRS